MAMQIHVYPDCATTSKHAAIAAGVIINSCIAAKGRARIVLSTGASQFDFLEHFVKQPVDWPAVEMFHLDEYLGIADTHPASFRHYLQTRFVSVVPVGKVHFVNGEAADAHQTLQQLAALANEAPFDLGLIGIGENAHIAFNDPPANFEDTTIYKIVDLDEKCKLQQVREGWFPTLADVPKQAITMTIRGIMSCKQIISVVPHEVKAQAIKDTLASPITNHIPATMLKTHPEWSLYLDNASASLLPVLAVPAEAALAGERA